jgi:pleiotropic regulator 1
MTVEKSDDTTNDQLSNEVTVGGYKSATSVQSQSILPTSLAQSAINNPNGLKTQTTETGAAKPSQVIAIFNDQQKTVAQKHRGHMLMPKPQWHAPWKLYRVISGHLGWVRCVDVEPGNEWFVTGAGDRIIKIWDLASGTLKLSLTGHISAVRGVCVSTRHPYLFSCGEDKQVKCWDLEYNKVIRHYHGHLSACYCLALHPSLDVLVSAGRDNSARVNDYA